MTNPYQSPALNAGNLGHPLSNEPAASAFWVKHFIAFQISFPIIWIALVCEHLGFSDTFSGILDDPHELMIMPAFGVGVWLVHAMVGYFYSGMRRPGATLSAVIGSVFFFVAMLLFENREAFLPRDVAMYLGWTPVYVYIPAYTGVSLSAVLLLASYANDRTEHAG